jgi:DNA-binding MarR family transcriptional regulator
VIRQQHYDVRTYRAQTSIGYLVKRAGSLCMDVLEPVFEEHGFTFLQYQILAWLRDGIALNPRDICQQYRHNSGALTRVIDQLEEKGFIERLRRDRDRRKVELQLTGTGRKVIEELVPLVVETLNLALQDFSSDEVKELIRLLMKFNLSLEHLDERAPATAEA